MVERQLQVVERVDIGCGMPFRHILTTASRSVKERSLDRLRDIRRCSIQCSILPASVTVLFGVYISPGLGMARPPIPQGHGVDVCRVSYAFGAGAIHPGLKCLSGPYSVLVEVIVQFLSKNKGVGGQTTLGARHFARKLCMKN